MLALLVFLACAPAPEPVDSGEVEVERDVPSAWTFLGCDPDGVYYLEDIEEQAGPQPWLLEARILSDGSWYEEDYEVQAQIVQVWWAFEPDPDECGLWAQSLWG